jgi:hypothetical protein
VTENAESVYCPQCSGTIYVPGRNWHGAELPQAYKCCYCEPPPVSPPHEAASAIVRDLTEDVRRLQKWVTVLARLIPQGSGPVTMSPSSWVNEDLHNMGLALPDHVLKGILELTEKTFRGSHPKGTISVNVCLYCGDSYLLSVNKLVENSVVLNGYAICGVCSVMRHENKEVFSWVSKIIKFGYVRAPEQMPPVMPPPPPPRPDQMEHHKVITLDPGE